MIEENKIIHADCYDYMRNIPSQCIDMIFTDLPYNTTNCWWDEQIDLDQLWNNYKRIIKPNGCIALWAQSPFDKRLAYSNPKMYRYEWIIEKTKATGHLNSKKMPMKAHENVLIFYLKLPTYNPQMTNGHKPVHSYTKHAADGNCYGQTHIGISGGGSTQRYPRDVLKFKWDTQKSSLHNCQKPVEACEYFIKTYTNAGDIVYDSHAGSCSIAEAAINTGRRYLCTEKDIKNFKVGRKRILQRLNQPFKDEM